MRTALSLAALAALILIPVSARAAACCMSATAVGVGRLLIWEDFAVGLRTSVGAGVGHWDARGRWHTYEGYEEVEARAEAWGLVALGRRAALYAAVPALLSWRRAGDVEAVGGGLGESKLGVRYEVLAIGEYEELPALAAMLTLSAPGSRAMHDARAPLAVDVTTRGAWVLGAGLSMERTLLPWFVRVDVGVTVPLPMERDDVGKTQRFGPGVTGVLALGREVGEGLVLAASLRATWESTLHLEERPVPNSDRMDLGAALTASWRFDPHWTAQLGVDSGFFTDGGGDNLPGRVVTSLGVRYGHF